MGVGDGDWEWGWGEIVERGGDVERTIGANVGNRAREMSVGSWCGGGDVWDFVCEVWGGVCDVVGF